MGKHAAPARAWAASVREHYAAFATTKVLSYHETYYYYEGRHRA